MPPPNTNHSPPEQANEPDEFAVVDALDAKYAQRFIIIPKPPPVPDVYPFGMTRPPFTAAPNIEFSYLNQVAQNLVDKIFDTIDFRGGVFVVQGASGTGKTVIARLLQSHLSRDPGILAAYIIPPAVASDALFLRSLCAGFHVPLPPRSERDADDLDRAFGTLLDLLAEMYEAEKAVVLLIDNAQTLTPSQIQLLSALTQYQEPTGQLLQIVLFIPPEFSAVLSAHPAFVNRITGGDILGNYDYDDAMGLLSHRMSVANGDFEQTFLEEVRRPLFDATRGNPGALCVLANATLQEVALHGEKAVGLPALHRAIAGMPFKNWEVPDPPEQIAPSDTRPTNDI